MKPVRLWLSLALSFGAAPALAQWPGTPPQPQPQPAFRAEDFLESVGINGSPLQYRVIADGPFKGAGATYDSQVFYDLGIRYYRVGLKDDLTLPDQPAQVKAAWEKSGARPMFLLSHNKNKPEDVVGLIKQYDPATVAEIEGPNEVNNKFPPQELNIKYGGKTDEAAGAAYMNDVYRLLKADPQTRPIPVVGYTAIFTDYRLAKGCTSFDFANMHSYQGYGVPSSSLQMNMTRWDNIYPTGAATKPFVPTETGYNVEADVANGTFKTGSLRAQALNIPMLFAEYFRHGIRRTYLFAIHNADGYGLLESDLKTKRPSYFALKNFLDQLRDAKWNPQTHRWEGGVVTPRALLFTLEGAPPTVHTLTLQKSSGEYDLLSWNEIKNLDEGSKKDILNPPVPVTLRFQNLMQTSATLLTQNDAGAYDSATTTFTNGVLALKVPSSVMIVKLRPVPLSSRVMTAVSGGALGGTVAAPANIQSTATENSVHLRWNAVPRAAGYFVWRNNWCIGATRSTDYEDRSAWLRPGLGYTYAIQSYDSFGYLSPRAEQVVQTAPRFPDLVIESIEAPRARNGEDVVFKATVRNAGNGATMQGTGVGVSFFVDGQFTSWSVLDGPIAPGETRVFTANGGPHGTNSWTATAGAHVLRVQLDDVNRVPTETNKWNNDADCNFLVDVASPGLLLGETYSARGQVDLTREGTLDWIHWGQAGKDSVTRKATGGHQISDITKVGDGYRDATPGFGMSVKWSDGTPLARVNDSHASYWLNNVGHGYEFSAPADTTERMLKVYVGAIEGARCRLEARLSDNSAPAYISQTWNGNAAFDWAPVPGGFTAVYTLRYRAATPNQKLTVCWILEGEPNRFLGQARLQA
ncbi:MAG: hypothetical protein JOZ57_06250, partial [Abitibacteriaceae bacterium]|nr:hypothetical protein [Abditibacteriaceae bacterium]